MINNKSDQIKQICMFYSEQSVTLFACFHVAGLSDTFSAARVLALFLISTSCLLLFRFYRSKGRHTNANYRSKGTHTNANNANTFPALEHHIRFETCIHQIACSTHAGQTCCANLWNWNMHRQTELQKPCQSILIVYQHCFFPSYFYFDPALEYRVIHCHGGRALFVEELSSESGKRAQQLHLRVGHSAWPRLQRACQRFQSSIFCAICLLPEWMGIQTGHMFWQQCGKRFGYCKNKALG